MLAKTTCFNSARHTTTTDSERATSENNCVKTIKERHILSVVQIFGRTLVSGDIRFVRIFGRVL